MTNIPYICAYAHYSFDAAKEGIDLGVGSVQDALEEKLNVIFDSTGAQKLQKDVEKLFKEARKLKRFISKLQVRRRERE